MQMLDRIRFDTICQRSPTLSSSTVNMASSARDTTGPTVLTSRSPLHWRKAPSCSFLPCGHHLSAPHPSRLEKNRLASIAAPPNFSMLPTTLSLPPLCLALRTTTLTRKMRTSCLAFTIHQRRDRLTSKRGRLHIQFRCVVSPAQPGISTRP